MAKKTKKQKNGALSFLKLLGIALIIVGVFYILADEDHTGAYGGTSRASTSIEFGGDFYTTSAQYTGLAANALVDLYGMIQNAIGIFFVFIGGVDCGLVSYIRKKQQESVDAEKAPQETITPNGALAD